MKHVRGLALIPAIMAVLSMAAATSARAETITWTAVGAGGWHTAANWDLGRVPGPGDDVVIPDLPGTSVAHVTGVSTINSLDCDEVFTLSGGTLDIAVASSTSNTFTLSGSGVLTGTGDLQINGPFSWTPASGCTMSGSGITTIAAGVTWTWGGGVLSRTLRNDGACNRTGTFQAFIDTADVFENRSGGTVNVQGSGSFAGSGLIDNQLGATFTFSTGPNVDLAFSNSGSLLANVGSPVFGTSLVNTSTGAITTASGAGLILNGLSGTYTFAAGSTLTNNGTVRFQLGSATIDPGAIISSPGTLTVTSGTHTLSPAATIGTLSVQGGSLTSNGDLTIGTLTLSNGTLDGDGDFQIMNGMSWVAGTMAGLGNTTVGPGVTWSWTSGALTRTLQNDGICNRIGTTGAITISTPGAFENRAGATLDIQTGLPLNGTGSIANQQGAAFLKSAGGTCAVQPAMSNAGSISVTTGELSFSTNLANTSTGSIAIGVGGTLRLQGSATVEAGSTLSNDGVLLSSGGGTTTIDAAATFTCAGTLLLSSGAVAVGPDVTIGTLQMGAGSLNGAGNLQIEDGMSWTGTGTMSGSGLTTVGAGVTWTWSGGTLTRTLRNDGICNRTGTSTISITSPGTFENRSGSTLDLQSDGGLSSTGTVQNQSGALLVKSAGTGQSSIACAFSNAGTLRVSSGTLFLSGAFANFASNTLTGGTYEVLGTFKFNNANIVTNAATIHLDGPSSIIANQSGVNGLANFQTNNAAGSLTIKNDRLLTVTSVFANAGALEIGPGTNSRFHAASGYLQTAGTTNIKGGILSGSPLLEIRGGTLAGNGSVIGAFQNGGVVAVGASPGSISFSHHYTQTHTGQLLVELAGLSPGTQHDEITVAGTATLNGSLQVSLIDGFVPVAGDYFDILTAGTVSGSFATDDLPLAVPSACIASAYLPAAVRLMTLEGPAIVQQPLSQNVCVADTLLLSVGATGDSLSFEWRKEGVLIPGANGPQFEIASAAESDSGSYTVLVANACNAIESAAAVVTVSQSLTITQQPSSQVVCAGASVQFEVAAAGGPPAFQWRKDGVDIPGAIVATLSIPAASASDAGTYDVVLSGACGPLTSDAATLTVNECATITWTGGGGDRSWHTAGNWDLGRVPAAGDDVVIPDLAGTPFVTFTSGLTAINSLDCDEPFTVSGGTLDLASASSMSSSFALSGSGVLAGGGDLHLGGSFTWTSGTMSGTGVTSIAPGVNWTWISGTLNRTLQNDGTCVRDGTPALEFIRIDAPGLFVNRSGAVFDIRVDHEIIGTGAMENQLGATFVKSAATQGNPLDPGAIVRCGVTNSGSVASNLMFLVFRGGLVNTGTGVISTPPDGIISLETGSYSLAAGSTVVNNGTLESSGTTLIDSGVTFSGSGTLTISGGTTTIQPDLSLATLRVEGGTLTGTGNLLITDGMLLAGTMSGSGVTTVSSGVTWDWHESSLIRVLRNDGTCRSQGGAGNITIEAPGSFQNRSGAILDIRTGRSFVGSGSIENTQGGIVRRSTGGGVASVLLPLINAGALNIDTQQLICSALDVSPTGSVTIAPPGTLNLSAGSCSFPPGSSLANAGTLTITGAIVTIDSGSNFTCPGTLSTSSGTLAIEPDVTVGSLTLTNGTLTGAGDLQIANAMGWTNGTMSGSGVTTIAPGITWSWARGTLTRTLQNDGTCNTGGPGQIDINAPGEFENRDGATLSFVSDKLLAGTGSIVNQQGAMLLGSPGTFGSQIACSFTNFGTLRVPKSHNLAGAFTNFSSDTLTGGTYDIVGELRYVGANIVTNAATIILDGPLSRIRSSSPDALVGFQANSSGGSFTIKNGRNFSATPLFANAGTIEIGPGASAFTANAGYQQTGGATNLEGGTLASSSLVDIQGGSLTGSGTVSGNLQNGGIVAAGASPGAISVSGDYTQTPSGQLTVELAGLTPGTQHDVISVSGTANLDGALEASLIDGFVPASGDSFDVLTASSVNGQFANDNLPLSAGSGCVVPAYLPASLRLSTRAGAAISQQPVSQSVCLGSPLLLTVGSTGDSLTFEWQKDGVPIPGASGPQFLIASAAGGDAGSYTVTVANECNSVLSDPAVVSVTNGVAILQSPTNQTVCAGGPATFLVSASGDSLAFQWRKDGVAIPGAADSSYTIASVVVADAGSYDVLVTGSCGFATSGAGALAVNDPPAISQQPENLAVCAGSQAIFSVTATGTALTYQWRKDAIDIPGATGDTLSIASAIGGDAGSYDVVLNGTCGSITSAAATLIVNQAPAISQQPTNLTVCEGTQAIFSVTATGDALTFQWRKDSADIPGAVGSNFTITSAIGSDAGSYDVVIAGSCGSLTSNPAMLTVNEYPAISQQPASQTACEGSEVVFSITATGDSLTYQWRKDAADLPGAVSSTFTIPTALFTDAGSYDVVLNGTCGTLTSAAAVLTVETCGSPTITWTGNAGTGSWHTNGNWNLNRVPGAGDNVVIPDVVATTSVTFSSGTTSINSLTAGDVLILNGGTLDVAASSSSTNSLSLNGGTLTGTGDLVVSGDFSFGANSQMTGAGTTTIAAGTIWSWNCSSGGNNLARTLVNNGTGIRVGGFGCQISSPGVLRNMGGATFDLQADTQFSGSGTIENQSGAMFVKSSGAGTCRIDPVLTNDGTVHVASGTLYFDNTITNNGSVTVPAGTTLQVRTLNSGAGSTLTVEGTLQAMGGATTIDPTAAFTAPGTVVVNSNFSLGPDVTIGSLSISDGNLTGEGDITFATSFSLGANASLGGSGTFTVPPGTTWSWNSSSGGNTIQRTFINYGTANRVGGFGSQIASPGIFRNEAGATVDIQGDPQISGNGVIENRAGALFVKSSGAGTCRVDPTFVNDGTVHVASGTLYFDNTVTNNGSVTVPAGTTLLVRTLNSAAGSTLAVDGTLRIESGTTTIDPAAAFTAPGTVIVNGNFSLGPDVTIGTLSVSTGNLMGAGDILVADSFGFGADASTSGTGTLTIPAGIVWSWNCSSGGNTVQRTFINYGTANRIGGFSSQIASPGVFRNMAGATLDVQGDFNFTGNGLVENQAGGLFVKSAGAGTASVSPTLTNLGTVKVASGRLDLTGTFSNFSAGTLTGGTYDLQGELSYVGGDVVTSEATVILDGPPAILTRSGGGDALASLATNGTSGSLMIENGKTHTVGSLLANNGIVVLGQSAALTANSGYRQLAGETRLEEGSLASTAFIDLQEGFLRGSGTIDGNLTNDGVVAAGASPGGIVVNGNYTQTAGGVFQAEIAGLNPATQYDNLHASGTAAVDGELVVSVIEGFVPSSGDAFDVITAPLVTGTFAADNLPLPAGPGCMEIAYQPAAVRIRALELVSISRDPVDASVCADSAATFSVTATGNGITFQWRKDGAGIPGASDSTFTISSATPVDAGTYDVVVTGSCGAVTSNPATLDVDVPPTITQQPAPLTACMGDTARFAVTAVGENLQYQWKRNLAEISGATDSVLVIPIAQFADSGSYSVAITGTCGSLTSQAAVLTVEACASSPGACCQPSGSCAVMTLTECDAASGTYAGAGSICVPDPCEITSAEESELALPPNSLLAGPNPFTETLSIRYSLAGSNGAQLAVFDATGRLVRQFETTAEPGLTGRIEWDGRTESGLRAGSGVYYIRMTGGGKQQTRVVTMLR